MTPRKYKLTLLTPLFSRGSYDATFAESAEIRAPSIRGQLHYWLRQLGYGADLERAIFGAVQKGFGGEEKPSASKIVIRVANIQGRRDTPATLPHKQGGQASPKAAHVPGTSFELHVLERLGGLTPDARVAFDRTLEAWLLGGTLGLRGTRASGSFCWECLSNDGPHAPVNRTTYETALGRVLEGAPVRWALLEEVFQSAEDARHVVSDTIGGREDRPAQSELARIRDPLGKVFGGRKTSPLRFRIVVCEGEFRVLAHWDSRSEVTGNSTEDLRAVIDLLARGTTLSRPKEIGRLLAGSALAR